MGETLLKIADRLGIPVAILVVCGIGLWQSAQWTATNVVTPLVNSHTILVNELREKAQNDSATLKVIVQTQSDISKTQSDIANTQHEIKDLIQQRVARNAE